MSFYCDRHVSKTRSSYSCSFCDGTIPKGSPCTTAPSECMESTLRFHDECVEFLESIGIDDVREIPEFDDAMAERFEAWRQQKKAGAPNGET